MINCSLPFYIGEQGEWHGRTDIDMDSPTTAECEAAGVH